MVLWKLKSNRKAYSNLELGNPEYELYDTHNSDFYNKTDPSIIILQVIFASDPNELG